MPCPDDVKCSDWRTFLPVIGQVYWNSSLLVPLYGVNESLRLEQMSVEVICGRANPEAAGSLGEKRGLKNAPREGLFYPFDLSALRSGLPIVLCEGFMSGLALSLLIGGKLPVVCAMSVGNFAATAQTLGKFVQDSPLFLVPDVGGIQRRSIRCSRVPRWWICLRYREPRAWTATTRSICWRVTASRWVASTCGACFGGRVTRACSEYQVSLSRCAPARFGGLL